MRFLQCVLLVTLVTFLSSCEAASADPKKELQRVLYSKLTSRGPADAYVSNNDKRFLRGESNKIETTKENDGGDPEERGVVQKIREAFRDMVAKYRKWENKVLVRRFKELAAEGKTATQVDDKLYSRLRWTGWWSNPSGYERFVEKYKEWCKINFPDLAK